MDLGDDSYDNFLISSGYAKIKPSKASNEVKYDQVRYGGTPVFKDAYPINIPGVITNGSSYDQGTKPALSAQKDPMDVEKFTWLFTYAIPRNETNHLLVGYMFEMNNSGHDLLEGDVALTFEYEMTVYNDNWWILFNKNHTFSGSIFRNHY